MLQKRQMSGPVLEHARELARHEHARVALEQVLGGCRESGIDVLPVKGVLTARLLYTDPGQRPIQDVDLRVRSRDLPRVRRTAERCGWRLLARSWAYRTLAFDVLGFLVEFEAHVGPPGLCALRVEDMITRAQRAIDPLGFPHLQPELHDHTLLLCVNAFKDKLVDALPGATRDLEIIARARDFVPRRFVDLAVETRSVTIAWIVSVWLAEERNATAWQEIRNELGRAAPRRRYARVLRRALGARGASRQLLRVLARMGSDSRSDHLAALGIMAIEPLTARFVRPRSRNVPRSSRTELTDRACG